MQKLLHRLLCQLLSRKKIWRGGANGAFIISTKKNSSKSEDLGDKTVNKGWDVKLGISEVNINN
jgi:multimeric flavodoxin WrbA